jgi:hypothetical protein
VTFTAATGGTYTFTYQAQDSATALSNAATVTVQVAAAETLTISKSEFVTSKNTVKVAGNVAPAASELVTIEFVDSAGTVLGQAGSATTDAFGAFNYSGTAARPTGATAYKSTTAKGTVRISNIILK